MSVQPDIIWNEQCLGIRIGEEVTFTYAGQDTPVVDEEVTFSLCGELLGVDSENAWFSFVKKNYRYLFPQLCSRSRFNRTRRALMQMTAKDYGIWRIIVQILQF